MTDNVKPSRNKSTWIRFAYMLLFALLVGAARLVLFFCDTRAVRVSPF